MSVAAKPVKNDRPIPWKAFPEILCDDVPGLAELHRRAWELVWDHVVEAPGAPCSPCMDEGFARDRIWIWDTCFMALFCKYAPDVLPGVESLENFYRPIHDGAESPLRIHHLDNPPLFAWVEWEHYCHTGNRARLERVHKAGWLEKHFALMESLPPGKPLPCAEPETQWRRVPMGYHWAGCPSGMDNTPRGGGGNAPGPRVDDPLHGYNRILWLDALAQQALSALCIARIHEVLGDAPGAARWHNEHARRADLLNRHYWDEADGIYYDIEAAPPHRFYKVKTPAAYWPLLAEVCSGGQAARLAEHVADPRIFGGIVPFPSVARNDAAFDPDGGYWRGGVWLPVATMAVKALERHGHATVADDAAERLVRHMIATWRTHEPPTIWEAYSPTRPRPATGKRAGKIARPDFCGWSALGPLSLAIENVLGFDATDGHRRHLRWRLHRRARHGIRNLRFGGLRATLIFDGKEHIAIETDGAFTLEVAGRLHAIPPGIMKIAAREN